MGQVQTIASVNGSQEEAGRGRGRKEKIHEIGSEESADILYDEEC